MTVSPSRFALGRWGSSIPSLEPHLEAGSLRVRDKVYVMGGYQTLCDMGRRMQVFDLATGVWSYGPPFPPGFPLSHAGVASDGAFLFVVSGQPGPACEPATNRAWALDLLTHEWQAMAAFPAARYALLLEYVDGNLHAISGAIEDRETITCDHFVLKIRDPHQPISPTLPHLEDQEWQPAPPIPEGGDHAGSVVLNGKIYVVGGEHGHAPMTMDASKCCGTYWVHDSVFRYDPETERWDRLADLPFGTSHMESQIVVLGGRIIVLGGTGNQDAFIDKIQEYDPARDRWRVLREPLPAARKGGVVWEQDGMLFFNGGQVMTSSGERPVVAETMAAKIVGE